MAAHVVRRALDEQLAEVEAVHVVADAHDERHVVLDHRDRQPEVRAQLEQRVAELVRLLRTHARRRLVEQQHLRVGGEHRRDLDALQRAVRAGRRPGCRAGRRGRAPRPARRPSTAAASRSRTTPACRASRRPSSSFGLEVLRGHQVLAHRRALDETDVLERAPEPHRGAIVHRRVGDVDALQDRPGRQSGV